MCTERFPSVLLLLMPSTHADTMYGRRRCDRTAPPLLQPYGAAAHGDVAALGQTKVLAPRFGEPIDAAALVKADEPALLRDTGWAPRQWTWAGVRAVLTGTMLEGVIRTTEHHYLVPDSRAALDPWVRYHEPHELRRLRAETLIDELSAAEGSNSNASTYSRRSWRSARRRTAYFSVVPEAMRVELQPQAPLYATKDDQKKGQQFLWLSSPGMRTHTHFDSDRNVFVQLLGRKRFVLWHPNETRKLCPYPRLHPLWHKSRADFEAPDLRVLACANYSHSVALVAEVQAGDVLYVPPYWWHTVETLSPSLSLSTLSRWPALYEHLNSIYGYDFLWDELLHYDAKAYALRTFIAKLMRKAEAPNLMADLLIQYAGLEHLATPRLEELAVFRRRRTRRRGRVARTRRALERGAAAEDAPLDAPRPERGNAFQCAIDVRGTPICRWCLGRINLDLELLMFRLQSLPAAIRYHVMSETIEEFTAEALGASEALAFWRECFGAQPSPSWFLTEGGTPEHERLWTTKIAYERFDSSWEARLARLRLRKNGAEL